MDFAAELARIRDKEEYGVRTTRDWNRYYAEWDRVHPFQARIRKVAGTFLLWAFTAIYLAAILLPVIIAIKGPTDE